MKSPEINQDINDKGDYKSTDGGNKEKFKGVSLSKGYGIGVAAVHRRRQAVTKIIAEDKEQEQHRLEAAHTQMNIDLDEKFDTAKLGMGEHVDILEAYRMLAKDKG